MSQVRVRNNKLCRAFRLGSLLAADDEAQKEESKAVKHWERKINPELRGGENLSEK